MKPRLLLAVILLLVSCAHAQTPPTPSVSSSDTKLQITAEERQFFELGLTLSRAAFAYAELAKQAETVAKTRSKIAQVGKLGKLEPLAQRNRITARDGFAQTVVLMRALHAPAAALAPVQRAADRLTKPLALSADAKPLALFNANAAKTLSALNEFETLSSLPEVPALRNWLTGLSMADSALVWYGEGEIAGLAQIAAADQMPDLLPPTEQIATDLRGLRDWLSLRLPDPPSPEQASLKNALENFLQEAARTQRLGVKSRKRLTLPQLQELGTISGQLQAQVLGPAALSSKLRSDPESGGFTLPIGSSR